jgi:hypothetical protein
MNGEIERLVASLNDHPDLLHGDRTPAVEALVRHGVDALPHVLPLLEDGDEPTRMRAQRVLEGVTQAWVRERNPARPLTQGAAREWQRLWAENGSYDWRAPAGKRAEAVRLWRDWAAKAATGEG